MIKLEHGNYCHIYNRGVNRCNLFYTTDNYSFFLRQYEKYIDPIIAVLAITQKTIRTILSSLNKDIITDTPEEMMNVDKNFQNIRKEINEILQIYGIKKVA